MSSTCAGHPEVRLSFDVVASLSPSGAGAGLATAFHGSNDHRKCPRGQREARHGAMLDGIFLLAEDSQTRTLMRRSLAMWGSPSKTPWRI